MTSPSKKKKAKARSWQEEPNWLKPSWATLVLACLQLPTQSSPCLFVKTIVLGVGDRRLVSFLCPIYSRRLFPFVNVGNRLGQRTPLGWKKAKENIFQPVGHSLCLLFGGHLIDLSVGPPKSKQKDKDNNCPLVRPGIKGILQPARSYQRLQTISSSIDFPFFIIDYLN